MSTLDPFPADQNRIIRDLQRRIEQLEAQVRTIPGAPVTRASGALFLPNASASAQFGGASVYAVGGQFRVIQSDGNVVTIPAAHVVNQANMTAGSAPGAYSSSHSQALRDDIATTRNHVFLIQTSLRNATIMATS